MTLRSIAWRRDGCQSIPSTLPSTQIKSAVTPKRQRCERAVPSQELGQRRLALWPELEPCIQRAVQRSCCRGILTNTCTPPKETKNMHMQHCYIQKLRTDTRRHVHVRAFVHAHECACAHIRTFVHVYLCASLYEYLHPRNL